MVLSEGEVLQRLREVVFVIKGHVLEGVRVFEMDEKLIVHGLLESRP